MKLNRKLLGDALREAREAYRLNVRQVAERTGVSRSAISRAERGHPDAYASADTILILARFYGVDPRLAVDVFHGNTPSGQDQRVVA